MSTNNNSKEGDPVLFWGCFIALITTAFAFITRAFLVNDPGFWPKDFGFDTVQGQELFGAGIWPFAISIIIFSLIIDKIGYKVAMIFSFVCYVAYSYCAIHAYGMVSGLEGEALKEAQVGAWGWLYWGSVILGLGNGTVEAFINPVVATMYKRDKTKWLNILHAGWPGGLVIGGLLTLALSSQAAEDWRILIYLIAGPAIIYLIMLMGKEFPENERVSSGVSYREMLAEFGVIGAAIAGYLIFKQLGMVFGWSDGLVYGMLTVSVIAYGVFCQSLGRPLLIFLCIIMMPLATTELGTDGAITGIMAEPMQAAGYSPLLVLIYTSAIMMVLRFFFAGPIVNALTPIGLLIASAAFAIVGLFMLSSASTMAAIFIFATLYGIGKTFFWPTMLGVTSEQCPKGGALTLNAIAGIGMLTVGIVGGPLIGKMQEDSAVAALKKEKSEIADSLTVERQYFLGAYTAVDSDKVTALDGNGTKEGEKSESEKVNVIIKQGKQAALANITIFPIFMLGCYIALGVYFKGRGGYKAVNLDDSGDDDSGDDDSGDDDSGDNDSGDNDSGDNDSGSDDSGGDDSGDNDSGSDDSGGDEQKKKEV